ncbi:class I SAM-dependent methyltransferase [Aequorivita marisscotiae]|uniref:Methyltransferase domain-containing protein n=1 Tax=Aequorivita marisscotiae TaxID=3040348 RepID=A0ABY8KUL6_9FLAO|nr:methyltransferase domain-containing protein [Aequorivita sp. Ant34-E75]WGF92747.1 methyltransferase domain-containing protein [Aequorivita sp. Ant34-E75]
MSKTVPSPLKFDALSDKIESFETQKICRAYKAMGIDVTRYFKDLKEIELFQCRSTGYKFYYPFSVIGDAEFYKELSLKRENYYSTRWEHLQILPSLNTSQKILEIGSGFGVFLNLLKGKGITAEGIELNPEALNNCKEQQLKVHNQLIEDFVKDSVEQFDVVCYFQVLEHITNIYDFISNSLLALKPGGRLIIGVPNNNPYLFINDKFHTLNLPPHHAGLWDKNSLKSLEKIFNISLDSLTFEPLEKTYNQFLPTYLANTNAINAFLIKSINKIAPRLLKKLMCRFVNGRNIIAVFKK